MAEIVNLKRAKKRALRDRDAAGARENRVRFGRTAAEKQRDQRAEAEREALIRNARLEPN